MAAILHNDKPHVEVWYLDAKLETHCPAAWHSLLVHVAWRRLHKLWMATTRFLTCTVISELLWNTSKLPNQPQTHGAAKGQELWISYSHSVTVLVVHSNSKHTKNSITDLLLWWVRSGHEIRAVRSRAAGAARAAPLFGAKFVIIARVRSLLSPH